MMLLLVQLAVPNKPEPYWGVCPGRADTSPNVLWSIEHIPIIVINGRDHDLHLIIYRSVMVYYKTVSLEYHLRIEKACPRIFSIYNDRHEASLMETNGTILMDKPATWNMTVFVHSNYQSLLLVWGRQNIGDKNSNNNCSLTETLWLLIAQRPSFEKEDNYFNNYMNYLMQLVTDDSVTIDTIIEYVQEFEELNGHKNSDLSGKNSFDKFNIWFIAPLLLIFFVIFVVAVLNDLLLLI